MTKTRKTILLAGLMMTAVLLIAQSKPGQNAPAGTNQPAICPMSGMVMGGPGAGMIAGVPGRPAMTPQARESMFQNMTGAFNLSPQEIASALGGKKAELGLSDAQIRKLAEVIDSSQKAKAKQHFDKMATESQCGICPGMQASVK